MTSPSTPAAIALLIAVDGPAASGKGTVARALAAHYQLPHMDTGLLYRAVAVSLLRFGGDPGSEFEAMRAVAGLSQVGPEDPELRTELAGSIASRISAYPGVRGELVERQREFVSQDGGAVLDGRDIGTVVAPQAPVKIFLLADPTIRAARRSSERPGVGADALATDLRMRDEKDAVNMRPAADAVQIDTTDLEVAEVVAMIEELVVARRHE